MDPILLIRYIVQGDLPAYYPDTHAYFDPKSPKAQNTKINPEKFIYLRSEIDELIMIQPMLDKSDDVTKDDNGISQEDKENIEYARILFEESKFDDSLKSAIDIGIKCAEEKGSFSSDEFIIFIDNFFPGIPVSSIKLIWEALPNEFKKDNDFSQPTELSRRENIEYQGYYPDKSVIGVRQKLKTKETTIKKRNRAIKSALMVSYKLKKEGKQKKRQDIENMIDNQFGDVTSDASKRIIRLLPKDFKFGSGNPRKKKD